MSRARSCAALKILVGGNAVQPRIGTLWTYSTRSRILPIGQLSGSARLPRPIPSGSEAGPARIGQTFWPEGRTAVNRAHYTFETVSEVLWTNRI